MYFCKSKYGLRTVKYFCTIRLILVVLASFYYFILAKMSQDGVSMKTSQDEDPWKLKISRGHASCQMHQFMLYILLLYMNVRCMSRISNVAMIS